MSIPLGRVHIADEHDHHIIKAWFTETAPVVDDGYGGWETVDLPHRKQALNWKGRPRAQMTLAIVIDGFATGDDTLVPEPGTYGHKVQHFTIRKSEKIEDDIRQLEIFAQPVLNDHNVIVGPPAPVKVNGGGALPHDIKNASHLRWLINDIQWGAALWDDDGDRIRQEATLILLEWDTTEDNVGGEISVTPLEKKKKSNTASTKVVKTMYANDTLKTMANRWLGSTHLWRRIRNLNKKYNDPNQHLGKGKSIVIPWSKKGASR